MAKAFWKGAISFGLVVIPVRMYVATQQRTFSLHNLHKKCHTRPKQVWYCPLDDEYFTSRDTVKGYEYTKGKYVLLTDNDLEKVPVKTKHTIDIFGFVSSEDIDPVYFYDAHYLEPDELGVKPFSVLRAALGESGQMGLAKVALQRREHLCCLRPTERIMVLHTLHYQNEVRSADELTSAAEKPGAEELKMAKTLIQAMETRFQPDQYEDGYREALRQIIQAKIEGEEIEVPKVEEAAEVPDLMSALRQSIEAAQEKGKKEPVGARK